jgi:hypothetical protein
MTRGQGNNQWSGGIAAQTAPKNSECKNPLQNCLPRFFGIKTASSSEGPNYQRGLLLISAGATEGHFEGKVLLEVHQGGLFLHDKAPAHWPLATQKKQAYLGFQYLDPHRILRICPRRSTTYVLD